MKYVKYHICVEKDRKNDMLCYIKLKGEIIMKKSELVLPKQCVKLTKEEMNKVEGGAKDPLDYLADFLEKILSTRK